LVKGPVVKRMRILINKMISDKYFTEDDPHA